MDSTAPEGTSSKLPSFEEWLDIKIKNHPDHLNIALEGFYGGCVSAILRHWVVLRELSKDSHLFTAESEEFKTRQKQWWYHYAKMNILRGFLLQYYGIRPPVWKTELMSEREYCGVVTSEEDFKKFLLHKDSGFTLQTPEKEEVLPEGRDTD